ncbi:MAG: alpha/beta fold hydrolase [Balneolaceae bacterium]|nr:alpha/beta fold hydrolase [Balneolaceae bacterium]
MFQIKNNANAFSKKTGQILTLLVILAGIAACQSNSSDNRPSSGYLRGAEGDSIYYEVVGSAPDSIVVIHGGPGAGMHSFSPSLIPLAKHFTLIFYDQRGGGRSILPADTTRLKPHFFVEDLDGVRRHFNLNQMKVIAHSFGAVLLAEYAQYYPNHLGPVVLHGATGPVRSEAANYYRKKAEEATKLPPVDSSLIRQSSSLLMSLLNGTAENPLEACKKYEEINRVISLQQKRSVNYQGTICKAPPEAIQYYYKYTAQLAPAYFGNWDYSAKMKKVQSPVLVVYGQQDSLGIPAQKRWADSFPKGTLITVPEAGKAAFSDNPDELIPTVVSFFKEKK